MNKKSIQFILLVTGLFFLFLWIYVFKNKIRDIDRQFQAYENAGYYENKEYPIIKGDRIIFQGTISHANPTFNGNLVYQCNNGNLKKNQSSRILLNASHNEELILQLDGSCPEIFTHDENITPAPTRYKTGDTLHGVGTVTRFNPVQIHVLSHFPILYQTVLNHKKAAAQKKVSLCFTGAWFILFTGFIPLVLAGILFLSAKENENTKEL